jgi:hypothetical protein
MRGYSNVLYNCSERGNRSRPLEGLVSQGPEMRGRSVRCYDFAAHFVADVELYQACSA